METTMYDNLLLLPLFQGLSKNDMTTIIEKVKLNFQTFQEGDLVFKQGDSCHQLIFLLNGQLITSIPDRNHAFSLSEVIEGPCMIEPHSLFGMSPFFAATYRANTPVGIMSIDKSYIFTELNNYEIFRLNFLNLLSNSTQTAYRKLWNTHVGTMNEKLVNFLRMRCLRTKGAKVLQISMEELAKLIGETRINVSRLLNEMQDKGLVQLRRREIFIPEFEKMIEYLS